MTTAFRTGRDPLGCHRVLDPQGTLPQAADRLDNSLPPFEDEVQIAVERLNVDAASFTQLESTGRPVAQQIEEIVKQRGKMQNPVTGSGGMLLGRIAAIGPAYEGCLKGLPVGTPVATLVSLTLTPLHLKRILAVHPHAHQVEVEAFAMLPSSAPAAVVPADLAPTLALSVLDVCGAPALVHRMVQRVPQNGHMLFIGAGKSGVLSMAAARAVRPDLKLWAIDRYQGPLDEAYAAGLCDGVHAVDAADALAVRAAVQEFTHGALADAVIHMTSLPGTEMAGILATKKRGTCLYFGMATSFSRVALGAEGVGADIDLLIGNGFVEGHADLAMDLVRANPRLRGLMSKRLGL
jgi:L-erythro-3,5-diaminohexanoate dehydrogenase